MEEFVTAALRHACVDYAGRHSGSDEAYLKEASKIRSMKTRRELLDWLQEREPNTADFVRFMSNCLAG
jgi:hypothetical protein